MDLAIQLLLMIALGLWGGQWLATRFHQPLWVVVGAVLGMVGGIWVLYKRSVGMK